MTKTARATPELIHGLECVLKQALRLMMPPRDRAPDGGGQMQVPAGYIEVTKALIIVERGLRDQLEDPIEVTLADLKISNLALVK